MAGLHNHFNYLFDPVDKRRQALVQRAITERKSLSSAPRANDGLSPEQVHATFQSMGCSQIIARRGALIIAESRFPRHMLDVGRTQPPDIVRLPIAWSRQNQQGIDRDLVRTTRPAGWRFQYYGGRPTVPNCIVVVDEFGGEVARITSKRLMLIRQGEPLLPFDDFRVSSMPTNPVAKRLSDSDPIVNDREHAFARGFQLAAHASDPIRQETEIEEHIGRWHEADSKLSWIMAAGFIALHCERFGRTPANLFDATRRTDNEQVSYEALKLGLARTNETLVAGLSNNASKQPFALPI